jgi:hypothetical protein
MVDAADLKSAGVFTPRPGSSPGSGIEEKRGRSVDRPLFIELLLRRSGDYSLIMSIERLFNGHG